MNSFFIDFAVSTLITLLRALHLDTATRGAYRKVFLKVFALIWGVFGSDPDFQAVVGVESPVPPVLP